jgi:integrase
MKKEHRVPLPKQAIALLKSLDKNANNPRIFPSVTGKDLSDSAISKFMKEMRDRGEFKSDGVPHGFRSTFRDWAAEKTKYPDDIRKVASGHKAGNAVQEVYQRTDLLEKRRKLMADWLNFIDKPSPKVP